MQKYVDRVPFCNDKHSDRKIRKKHEKSPGWDEIKTETIKYLKEDIVKKNFLIN